MQVDYRQQKRTEVLEGKVIKNDKQLESFEEEIQILTKKINISQHNRGNNSNMEKTNFTPGTSNINRGAISNVPQNVSARPDFLELPERQVSHFVLRDILLPKFSNKPNKSPLQYLTDLEHFFEFRAVPEQ